MPRLPQPSTTSPGFLQLQYLQGSIPHVVRQRLISGVDPTDDTLMAATAAAWAAKLAPCMMNTCVIQAWRSLNPDGVELSSGVLSPAVSGSSAHGAVLASESSTFSLVGRGAPGGGLAQGNTRMEWFPGAIFTDIPGASTVPGAGAFADLITFINADAVIGADSYGTKAVFQNKIDLQINAHYQKRYGF